MRRSTLYTSMLLSTLLLTALTICVQPAQAQTFTVLHNFTGGGDGAYPVAGLTMDRAGNLYGTTALGGHTGGYCLNGCGTVFKLSYRGYGWILAPLYSFAGGNDGAEPCAPVVIAADGTLYGTTSGGGCGGNCGGGGCGTVFHLRPPPHAPVNILGGWLESVLYQFSGGSDGSSPGYGALTFDQAGNIYGTTPTGGSYGYGVVFELTPSGGGWTESVLFSFAISYGTNPYSGVILDQTGNLYGTAVGFGPDDGGTIYELASGGGFGDLYDFSCCNGSGGTGAGPLGGLIFDASGNLYGTTYYQGNGAGTVYELSPSNGGWTASVLYSFTGNGYGPYAKLVMDTAGNLFGTTYGLGAYGAGSVFELSPQANGTWTYTNLHDFTNGEDGAAPYSSVVLDANGNIYGTASGGGAYGHGVIFEITP